MKNILFIFLISILSNLYALEDGNMVGYRILEGSEIIENISAGKSEKNTLPEEFDVVVWNLFKVIKKDGLSHTLPKFLKSNDIGLFQEYESNDYLSSVFSSPNYFSVAGLTHQSGNDESTRAGVLIQSEYRAVTNSCEAFHSKQRELGLSPKATLICKFKLHNGRELLVMNVHALNFQIFNIGMNGGFGFGQAYRNQIKQWEDAITNHDGPIIIAGDFNTWNPLGRRLKRLLKMLENNSNGPSEESFKHIKRFFPDYRGRFLTLDHIFYRGLEVIGRPHTVKTKNSSDHNPLFVKFKAI